MTSFFLQNHQNKGLRFTQALLNDGFTSADNSRSARVILTDIDIPSRIRDYEFGLSNGAKLFLYPHGGPPLLSWDVGFYKPYKGISCVFVHAPGHEEVMRAIGYQGEIFSTGFSYCSQLPFQSPGTLERILFAPIHPFQHSGFMPKRNTMINRAAYTKLLKYCRDNNISLSVRFLGELHQNGLWHEDDVNFIHGNFNQNYTDILDHDLVVATDTYAYLAVARGKPVLFMGQGEKPTHGKKESTMQSVMNWNKYRDTYCYPLDILHFEDTYTLVNIALQSDVIIQKWRSRMIGDSFNESAFVNKVKSFL